MAERMQRVGARDADHERKAAERARFAAESPLQ
jgi:hypothetical protein